MRVQTLYAVAGLIWGLVLGPDAGLYAARMMGDVGWLYQYEEGAWADWVIVPFGAAIGLTVLFSCYQLGAAAGRRYDDATDTTLKHAKSVPWAMLVVGICVGAVTVLTIDDRQHAVVRYVQSQKDAAARLLVFAETLHRIPTYGIEWPGGGEAGRIDLAFRGKRKGDYQLEWKILSQDGTEPLLGSSYTVGLSEKHSSTNIPVSASELANAYIVQSKRRGADIVVDERFRLVLELRPLLNGKDWEVLPEDEPARLDDGDSILLDRATTAFRVQFESRSGRIEW
ncbi:MAG: hypothetical protein OEN55_02750 [Alphaproteobacteria bacterium]|nr:hypothetical protein [Alphaproteobacteria bacterium]